MKRIISLTIYFVALLIGIQAYSQTELRQPFIMDTINNKGEKLDITSFIGVPSYENLKTSKNFITIDENQLIKIEKPTENSYKINTYVSNIIVNSYQKTTLNVFCTDKVKIGLNGEMIKERLLTKDSLTDDSKISKEITLEPGKHIISITVITSTENPNHELRFSFEGGEIKTINKETKDSNYGLTLKEMLGGRNIYNTSISPSGKYVMVKYYDADSKGKRQYGYLVANKDKTLFFEEGNTSTQWAEKDIFFNDKNEDILYYFDKVNDNRRLIKQNLLGVKTVVAENLPEGSLNILPNKTQNAILTQTIKVDNSKDDLRQYLLPDDRIDGWRTRSLLSIYNFETQQIQPLTYGYRSTYLNDYNAKTNSILLSVSYDNITQRPFSQTSIYEMNLDSFKVDTIVKEEGFVSSASYIPNTDFIVIKASGEAFNGIGNTLKKNVIPNAYHGMLFLMDKKTKEVECISKNFDPSISSIKITENKTIYFTAENKDSVSLYVYSLDNKDIKRIETNLDIVSGFDINSTGKEITFFGQNYNDFPIVYLKDNQKNHKIYQAKDKTNLALGEMNTWDFSFKGTKINGRYYLPQDFDSQKKYPMIVYYYAGTSPTDRSFEMRYSAYLYTAQGYVVYVLNPSGTTGWGQEFASRHVNAWGERTADEIIYGVKEFTKQHSFVDATKIGCMGASYGGFMTQLLQTKTDIFACAISHAGISDITSYWGEGYWGYSYSSGATANSYPWNRRDIYVDRSPLFNADKINTPILLLHGDADTNVPIGESIQMYNALKILGKDVEFITVKGENHGIVDYEKRLKWNNSIYAYFAKYLKSQDSWWNAMYPKTQL